MSDDDQFDQRSTNPLPAVDADDERHATQPLQAQVGPGADPPTTPHQSALTHVDEFTEMIPVDVAMPGDDTGAIPAGAVFEDVPTQELPGDDTLVPQSEPRGVATDADATNPGAVSDDAIVRRVVLPLDLPTDPLPNLDHTQPATVPSDDTQFAVLPAEPRNPLPEAQLPPARGPIPLPQFQARANVNETRAANLDEMPAADRSTRVWIAGIGVALLWGLLANALGPWQWIAPVRMFALTLAGLLPVALALGAVARPQHRAFEARDVSTLLRPLAAATVVLLVAALPWQVGSVRASMRGLAATSPEMARDVLDDRSGIVALQECLRLAPDFAQPGVVELLGTTLADRPRVLDRCLAEAGEVSRLLSGTLVRTWYATVVQPDAEPATACAMAESIARINRPAGEVETRLLGCIMFARPEVQRCCASALAELDDDALDWVAKVQNQPGYVPDGETAKGLLALTFGAEQVTEEQAQFVDDADFQGAEPQRMAVVLGCAALSADSTLGAQLLASVPANCPLNRDGFPADADTWRAICDTSMDRLVRRRRDPGETLCLSARDIAAGEAISKATRLVSAAQKRAR